MQKAVRYIVLAVIDISPEDSVPISEILDDLRSYGEASVVDMMIVDANSATPDAVQFYSPPEIG